MSKGKWFPFYPSDWLHGTSEMTLEETGAYIQIVAILYECDNALELERIEHPVTGKLTGYSYKRLARRLNTRADKIERIVANLIKAHKLSLHAGFLTNARVGKELAKREMISNKNRENVSKRRDRQDPKVRYFKDLRRLE
jgi:uncharacterized protein YdaU (DUF1376 family)